MPARRPPRQPAVALGSGSEPGGSYHALVGSGAPKRPGVVSPALLALSERQFQAIVRAALESFGFIVWVVPNMRQTTAGLPDLVFRHERLPGRLYCWELKRERDYRVTPAQRAALAHLETVEGVDARIVRPSDWEALRDRILEDMT